MPRVRDEEYDIAQYRKTEGLTDRQIRIFKNVTGTLNFINYAKTSKKIMNDLLRKVRKGVKYGKYDDREGGGIEDKGFIMPKIKKKTGKKKAGKKKKKEEKKVIKPTKQKKKQVKKTITKKVSRKQKITERQKKEFAPSGRQYSKTELREGKGSQRAKEYRRKHGIAEGDFSV